MATLDVGSPGISLDSKLVDLVRANPVLYEKELRSTPYENMKLKNELWKSIATSLGVDAKYCVIRWKNLRDKFRRELTKNREATTNRNNKVSDWYLLEKMRFLESHIKYYGAHSKRTQPHHVSVSWNDMEAEPFVEEFLHDDPLQEAMDEVDRESELSIAAAAANITATPTRTPPLNLTRIQALLEGLDEPNRVKAEKRIVAYLCKCQLRSLNNEDVDGIII